MTAKEREAREDTLIVDHLQKLELVWNEQLDDDLSFAPHPDPCLHNFALVSELHTFDFWLN